MNSEWQRIQDKWFTNCGPWYQLVPETDPRADIRELLDQVVRLEGELELLQDKAVKVWEDFQREQPGLAARLQETAKQVSEREGWDEGSSS